MQNELEYKVGETLSVEFTRWSGKVRDYVPHEEFSMQESFFLYVIRREFIETLYLIDIIYITYHNFALLSTIIIQNNVKINKYII